MNDQERLQVEVERANRALTKAGCVAGLEARVAIEIKVSNYPRFAGNDWIKADTLDEALDIMHRAVDSAIFRTVSESFGIREGVSEEDFASIWRAHYHEMAEQAEQIQNDLGYPYSGV